MEKKLNSKIIFLKNEIKPLKVYSQRKTLTSKNHNFTIEYKKCIYLTNCAMSSGNGELISISSLVTG